MGIRIYLNGHEQVVPQGLSVAKLLEEKQMRPEVVVVELNGRILAKEELEATFLQEGDRVELIYHMGGGCWSFLNFER
jgi:thiamine biosynthesis protein ThiS